MNKRSVQTLIADSIYEASFTLRYLESSADLDPTMREFGSCTQNDPDDLRGAGLKLFAAAARIEQARDVSA